MLPRASLLAALAALTVSWAPPEDARTTLGLSGGTGSFALIARGCSDEVVDVQGLDFDDAAFPVDHRFDPGVAVLLDP